MPKTVLLTGATGYLAKHVLLQLLNAGYAVKGSMRSLTRADEVRAAVAPHLDDPDALERFSAVELDLTQDAGWAEAMAGVDVLMHTASPFPLSQPKDENDLIIPALEGTRRALEAAQAAGASRVVLTSSIAAICGRGSAGSFDESDWTDVTSPDITPYVKSKTLAEKAAWDFVADHPDMALTVINPGFIMGASLDRHYGTSLAAIERVLSGKDPAMPRIGFSTVDVRDVAKAHVLAIDAPQTHGKRIATVSEFLWFVDLAKTIAQAAPDRKIVTRQAPNWLMRLVAIFDPAIRQFLPSLDQRPDVSNAQAKALLGMEFRPVAPCIISATECVLDAQAQTA